MRPSHRQKRPLNDLHLKGKGPRLRLSSRRLLRLGCAINMFYLYVCVRTGQSMNARRARPRLATASRFLTTGQLRHTTRYRGGETSTTHTISALTIELHLNQGDDRLSSQLSGLRGG